MLGLGACDDVAGSCGLFLRAAVAVARLYCQAGDYCRGPGRGGVHRHGAFVTDLTPATKLATPLDAFFADVSFFLIFVS